jgi:hypothetical protein
MIDKQDPNVKYYIEWSMPYYEWKVPYELQKLQFALMEEKKEFPDAQKVLQKIMSK